MGIPSYFSYIIRNHMLVLKPFLNFKQTNVVHNFYMDCNSVIYDCIRDLEKNSELKPGKKSDNFYRISSMVCSRIQSYIDNVKPSNIVFIAFDGVAPMAKMCQQRTRRYKSAFTEKIFGASQFNSCYITPGTDFMNFLSNHVSKHFQNSKNIIVSSANEPGEGEHKLFQYIRENPSSHLGKNSVIYGLDADLLMLSIFHSHLSNLFVYREAPEFAKSLNANLKSGEPYVLNIAELCVSIANEMNCTHNSPNRVYDYAFLCFMLGNDFLPHFPAINIRTTGIYSLLDAYKSCLGDRAEFIVNMRDNSIDWQNFGKIVKYLCKIEDSCFRNEYVKRGEIKLHRDPKLGNAFDEASLNNAPLLFREKEHYINPTEHGWQQRYYKTLFGEPYCANISVNYLEGLEWVFKYYTDKCIDWHWKYEYNYPPLLEDLVHAIPKTNGIISPMKITAPLHPHTQLCFVLPPIYIREILPKFPIEKYQKYYGFNGKFEWAFCRYFWEAHLLIEEEIPLSELLKIDAEHHSLKKA